MIFVEKVIKEEAENILSFYDFDSRDNDKLQFSCHNAFTEIENYLIGLCKRSKIYDQELRCDWNQSENIITYEINVLPEWDSAWITIKLSPKETNHTINYERAMSIL